MIAMPMALARCEFLLCRPMSVAGIGSGIDSRGESPRLISTGRFCVAPDGSEVEVVALGAEGEGAHGESAGELSEESCHFHAGVE
jgi:hypothetical protein